MKTTLIQMYAYMYTHTLSLLLKKHLHNAERLKTKTNLRATQPMEQGVGPKLEFLGFRGLGFRVAMLVLSPI